MIFFWFLQRMLRSLCMYPLEKAVLYLMDRLESLGRWSRLEWQSKSFKEELATLYMVRFLIALQITESFFFQGCLSHMPYHQLKSPESLNTCSRKAAIFPWRQTSPNCHFASRNPLRASVIASKCILMSSWLWSQTIVRSLYRSR